jgi:hypothetical protein
MGNPGQWMPVSAASPRECPEDVFVGKACVDLRIVQNIIIVIEVKEGEVLCLVVDKSDKKR